MKVTWQPAPGNVLNYRVTYKPKSGGRQLAAKVPGGNTSTVLRRLTALTTYDITVLPVYRSGEGKAREGEGTTCMLIYQTFHTIEFCRVKVQFNLPSFVIVTPYKGPRNLQTSDSSRTSFRVTWDPAPGDVKGYKVRFHPVGEDIYLGELLVGPYDNTVVLEELRCVIWLKLFPFLVISLPNCHKNSLSSGLQSWYQIHSECVWHVWWGREFAFGWRREDHSLWGSRNFTIYAIRWSSTVIKPTCVIYIR